MTDKVPSAFIQAIIITYALSSFMLGCGGKGMTSHSSQDGSDASDLSQDGSDTSDVSQDDSDASDEGPKSSTSALVNVPSKSLLASGVNDGLYTLFESSRLGYNRATIRTYLAVKHPETPEGEFSRAWMKAHSGDHKAAVKQYSELLKRRDLKPTLRLTALLNRTAEAPRAKSPDELRYIEESLEEHFQQRRLDGASLHSVSEKTREIWLRLYEKYPEVIQADRANFLLGELRYQFYAKHYEKSRELLRELWSSDLDTWRHDFEFDRLLALQTSDKVYPDHSMVERLEMGGFSDKLAAYLARMSESDDWGRRATVASWGVKYAQKLSNADLRYYQHHERAFSFLHNPEGGAWEVYPSGEALALMLELWSQPRHHTRWPNHVVSLDDIERITRDQPKIASPHLTAQRGLLFALLGDFKRAESLLNESIRSSYARGDQIDRLYLLATRVLGASGRAYTHILKTFEELFNTAELPPNRDDLRQLAAKGLSLSFGVIDMTQARRWLDRLKASYNVSKAYVKNQEEAITTTENALATTRRFDPSKSGDHQRWMIEFKRGSSELTRGALKQLDLIYAQIKLLNRTRFKVNITGHCDQQEWETSLGDLSGARIKSVQRALSQRGLKPERVRAENLASLVPRALEPSERVRHHDSRVEVTLITRSHDWETPRDATLVSRITAVSPSGRFLVSTDGQVWDTRTWQPLYKLTFSWQRDRLKFSPDEQSIFIAHTSNYRSLGVIIHTETGGIKQLIPHRMTDHRVNDVRWSLDSSKLAFTTGNILNVYDVHKRQLLRPITLKVPYNWGFDIAWLLDDKKIAVVPHASAASFMIVDLESREMNTISAELSWSHQAVSSRDGRYLYISDDVGYILQYDAANGADSVEVKPFWRDVYRSSGVRLVARSMSVHPLNPQLLVANSLHTSHWGVVDFDQGKVYQDRVPAHLQSARRIPKVHWGLYGHELLVDGDWVTSPEMMRERSDLKSGIFRLSLTPSVLRTSGEVQLMNPSSLQFENINNSRLRLIENVTSRLRSVYAYDDLERIMLVTSDSIRVWDVRARAEIKVWDSALKQVKPALKSEPYIVYGYQEDRQTGKSTLIRFNIQTLESAVVLELDHTIDDWVVGERYIVIGGGPFLPLNRGASELSLKLFDVKTFELVAETQINAATQALQYGRISASSVTVVALSPNEEELSYVTMWADGYGYGSKRSTQIRRWRWRSDQKPEPIKTRSEIKDLIYESDILLRVDHASSHKDHVYNLERERWEESRDPSSRPVTKTNNTPLKSAFSELNVQLSIEEGLIRWSVGDQKTKTLILSADKRGWSLRDEE